LLLILSQDKRDIKSKASKDVVCDILEKLRFQGEKISLVYPE